MILSKIDLAEEKILQKAITAAKLLGLNIYLVGGTVRDLYLHNPTYDLDLAVEGNAIEYAQFLSPSLGGEVKKYEDFLSATIYFPTNNRQVDIITARRETYPKYGMLPKIEPADIITDLKRRDFSINALAIDLTKKTKSIIDPCGGLKDLEKGLLRILHQDSFKEDPIRIFRAARFMHRLRFTLEDNTQVFCSQATPYIKEVAASRIKEEFKKIVNEGNTLKILKQLQSWGSTPYFVPKCNINKFPIKILDFVKTWCRNKKNLEVWLIFLMLLYWQTSDDITQLLKSNLIKSKKEVNCVNWLIENKANIKKLLRDNTQVSFLQLHKIMYNVPEEAEIFILSLLGKTRYSLLSEIKLARKGVDLPLSGKDILKKGISPGPVIGEILNDLEQEVMKGNIYTKDDALEWFDKVRGKYAD